MVTTEILWQVKASKPFITVVYGKVFQNSFKSIVTGGEDGVIRFYEVPDSKATKIEPVRSLDAKCGPIFHVRLHDVIRLASQELITADSRGSVTVFCNGQIFMRKMTEKSSGITSLQIYETALGHLFIITGSEDGILNCFNAFDNLWRIRLKDILSDKIDNIQSTVSVTCILAAAISSSSCPAMDYFVIADSERHLHFVQDGSVHLTIVVPAVVQAMAVGHFLQYDESSTGSERLTQIALGCSDGSILICVDFEIQSDCQYADVGHPITHLHRLSSVKHSHPLPGDGTNVTSSFKNETIANSTSAEEKLDLLLCAGHFPAVLILREGKVLTKHPLPDWVISICDMEENQVAEPKTVLVGCLDSTLRAIKLS